MNSQWFVSIFLWVYVLQFMCCVDPEPTSKIPTSGPFKTSIASIKDCRNPSKPYLKNPPVVFQPITNNSTLSGTITFLKDTKNMKIKLRGFILRNDKWEPSYLINNLDCHGMVLHFMCAAMNVKYDRKNCLYFKGPFKTAIVSAKDCSNPRRPYLKNPPMFYNPSVENIDGKNILGGNLTVLKDAKNVKMIIKCFAMRNGKWRQIMSFNNLNCHGAMLHFTFAATGVKYDKKNCMFLKGFYVFQNLDVNQLQHIWVPSMPYGRLMWRTETFSKDGMFICKEFDTVTEPAYYG